MTNSELWHHLHAFLAKRGPPRPGYWLKADLPSLAASPMRTVVLPREQLQRFRADYAALVAFVCMVVGKRPEELCGFDLVDLAAMRAHQEWEAEERSRRLLAEEARRILPELEAILKEANEAADPEVKPTGEPDDQGGTYGGGFVAPAPASEPRRCEAFHLTGEHCRLGWLHYGDHQGTDGSGEVFYWPPAPASEARCPECGGRGFAGWDAENKRIPCPRCGGTGGAREGTDG